MQQGPTKQPGERKNVFASFIKTHYDDIRSAIIILGILPLAGALVATALIALATHEWPGYAKIADYFLLTMGGSLAGYATGWATTRSRRRKDDIGSRIHELSERLGCTSRQLGDAVHKAMMQHKTPGNIATSRNEFELMENLIDWAEKHEGLLQPQPQAPPKEDIPRTQPSGETPR